MSTGYWNLNSQSDYYNFEENFGTYQYQSLDDLINTFLAYYVGENKIIPKASKEDVAFFAKRAIQELTYDTLRSKNTWEAEVSNLMYIPLPHDFVGYTNIFWSSSGGIKRPLYPTSDTQNPFRPQPTDDPLEVATVTTVESVPETTAISSATKVYIFYDGTSMGVQQVQNSYDAVTAWLDLQEGFTRVEAEVVGQNVFHTVASSERWLDWACVPFTGKFENNQIKVQTGGDGDLESQQSTNVGGQADDFFKFPQVNQGHVDYFEPLYRNTLNPALNASKVSYWSAQGTSSTQAVQFYDTASKVGSGLGLEVGTTVTSADGDYVAKGPPPKAGATASVLIINFIDEAASAYHGITSTVENPDFDGTVGASPGIQDGLFTNDSGEFIKEPSSIYKVDYDEYKKVYDDHPGQVNAFMYPSETFDGSTYSASVLMSQFLLHTTAAISSGNKAAPDGKWTAGTAPVFATEDGSVNDITLTQLETENPYWNEQNPEYGGLDQYGWGIDTDGGAFDNAKFSNNLNDFISQQEISYIDVETTTTTVDGQGWYNINESGEVAGDYNSTTLNNYQSSESVEPGTYENSSLGQRYGLDPKRSQVNGSYYMDYANGKIFFAPSLVGSTIVIDYISDGLSGEGDLVIHKFAEEAFYKHVAYSIASTGSNYSPATVQMLKKERFAETRKAKLRLSNLKSQEMQQVMRGKSKVIKK